MKKISKKKEKILMDTIKELIAHPWAENGDMAKVPDEKYQQGWLAEIVPVQYLNWWMNQTDKFINQLEKKAVSLTDDYKKNDSNIAASSKATTSLYNDIQNQISDNPEENVHLKLASTIATKILNDRIAAIHGLRPGDYVFNDRTNAGLLEDPCLMPTHLGVIFGDPKLYPERFAQVGYSIGRKGDLFQFAAIRAGDFPRVVGGGSNPLNQPQEDENKSHEHTIICSSSTGGSYQGPYVHTDKKDKSCKTDPSGATEARPKNTALYFPLRVASNYDKEVWNKWKNALIKDIWVFDSVTGELIGKTFTTLNVFESTIDAPIYWQSETSTFENPEA